MKNFSIMVISAIHEMLGIGIYWPSSNGHLYKIENIPPLHPTGISFDHEHRSTTNSYTANFGIKKSLFKPKLPYIA